jgi:anti-sigma factor RsiW
MNAERELELQAYVDGELSGWRASRVRQSIATDPEARQLVDELTTTKTYLAANELNRPLPEAPDFYWNRIQQAIARCEQVDEAAAMPVMLSWRRILAPLAGVTMAVFLAILGFNWAPSQLDDSVRHVAEVENLSADTDSISFRSASENMFIVWVHDKTGTASDAEFIDEEDFSFE